MLGLSATTAYLLGCLGTDCAEPNLVDRQWPKVFHGVLLEVETLFQFDLDWVVSHLLAYDTLIQIFLEPLERVEPLVPLLIGFHEA
jgi:hypothetical protein